MSGGLASKLPPPGKSSVGMTFWKKASPAPKLKKPTVPDMKKVAKLLVSMGNQIAGIHHSTSGFTVIVSDPAQTEKASYWDKVLSK